VADDHAMGITEVVRGADLLLSTARQLLLYRALGCDRPSLGARTADRRCPKASASPSARQDYRSASSAKRKDAGGGPHGAFERTLATTSRLFPGLGGGRGGDLGSEPPEVGTSPSRRQESRR
jgi:hypothetical protein